MTIDWSKAPEGATHCDESVFTGNRWYRKKGPVWQYYCGGEWRTSCNSTTYNERLTPRPVVTAWRGPQDGLPPVGMEVEAQDGYSWQRGTVVAHVREARFGVLVIIQCEGFWGSRRADGIRPVKTERERAIEEMLAAWKPTMGRFAEEKRGLAEMLYDAGYRKGEPT